jgi:beta-N-acetylhexosaminidase
VSAGGSQPASCVAHILAAMTEEQRVGQLFMLGVNGSALSDAEKWAIENSHLGSVWLVNNRRGGIDSIRPLASEIQDEATTGATHGVGFFVAADQEGGLVQRLAGPGFSTIPAATALGQVPVAKLESDAASWGRELGSAGINVNLAPVMDVVPSGTDSENPPIGALEREYGHDPKTVADHGSAVVRGMAQAGIATTLKHFPGLGRVTGNTDTTAGVTDTATTADDPYLASFRAGIAAGAPFVMISLASYEAIDAGVPAVFSTKIIGTLLRGGLGFDGVVISDDLGAAAAVRDVAPGDRAIDFIAAGGDLMIVQGGVQTGSMAAAVVGRAGSDATFAALVDAAALKVLQAKDAYGLLNCG